MEENFTDNIKNLRDYFDFLSFFHVNLSIFSFSFPTTNH